MARKNVINFLYEIETLIDGDKLTSLMIELGLGIQIERGFHIYKIDQDHFDEDNF